MTITVRPIQKSDADAWKEMYAGYRAFYDLPESSAAVDTTWCWMLSGEHAMTGLIAVDEDDLPIAFANLRWFARPSSATIGLYLDDLFTSQNARGIGAGSALLHEAALIARAGGASVVRWITAADNDTARSLYNRHARETRWVTYDMTPASLTAQSPEQTDASGWGAQS